MIRDAQLLARFVAHYRDQLRPLTPNSELTRKIATIAEDRRRLVDQRADLANELTALLKRYFPAALELKPTRTYCEFFLKFLKKYPSLSKAQAASVSRLRSFFHGLGMKAKADDHARTSVNKHKSLGGPGNHVNNALFQLRGND